MSCWRSADSKIHLETKQVYNLLGPNRTGNLRDKAIRAAREGWKDE